MIATPRPPPTTLDRGLMMLADFFSFCLGLILLLQATCPSTRTLDPMGLVLVGLAMLLCRPLTFER